MKKSHIILLILIINTILVSSLSIAWLVFDTFDNDPFALFFIIIIAYIMPLTLFSSFIIRNNDLTGSQKQLWFLYLLFTSIIGCFHYYFRFSGVIDQIANDSNKKMREGPSSLSEFNRSKRLNDQV